MAFDPDRPLADDPGLGRRPGASPRMLLRPAEPSPAVGQRLGCRNQIWAFRREYLVTTPDSVETPGLGPLRVRLRAWAGRVSGRSDRRLLFASGECDGHSCQPL